MDYNSLYPSITKTFKISIETFVGRIDNYQVVELYNVARYYNTNNLKFIKDELFPIYYEPDNRVDIEVEKSQQKDIDVFSISDKLNINIEYTKLYSDRDYPEHFNGLTEFVDWLRENNYALLPNGAVFDQNKDDAIISSVVIHFGTNSLYLSSIVFTKSFSSVLSIIFFNTE